MPVLPASSGVKVWIDGAQIEPLSPPTIEQLMLQTGSKTGADLESSNAVLVTRLNGERFVVRRHSYAVFMLKDGDFLFVPKRFEFVPDGSNH